MQNNNTNQLDDDANDTNERTFPLECFPDGARQIIHETSLAFQIPQSLPSACVLAAVSETLGAGIEVQTDPEGNGRLAGNLFLLAVAESGTGKSQGYNQIMAPLDALGKSAREAWERDKLPGIIAEIEDHQATIGRLKKEFGKSLDPYERADFRAQMEDVIRLLHIAEGKKNERPVWNAGESTREELAVLTSGQIGQAISSRSGDARGIISVLAGRYAKGTEGDEDIFLHLYSRDSKAIHRRSSAPIELTRPTGSVLWMVQPDKIREMMKKDSMMESGLLPRFLAFDSGAMAEDLPEHRHKINEGVKGRWAQLLADLATEYRANGNSPRVVIPTMGAFNAFRLFDNDTRRRRRTGGDACDVAPFAARWAENAWRLALGLHAILHGASAHERALDEATATAAIEMQRWFIGKQLELLAAGRTQKFKDRADKLFELVAATATRSKSVRDLHKENGFSKTEIEKIAANNPFLELDSVTTGGRPSLTVFKLETSKSGKPVPRTPVYRCL